jgi:hypothetical protein
MRRWNKARAGPVLAGWVAVAAALATAALGLEIQNQVFRIVIIAFAVLQGAMAILVFRNSRGAALLQLVFGVGTVAPILYFGILALFFMRTVLPVLVLSTVVAGCSIACVRLTRAVRPVEKRSHSDE